MSIYDELEKSVDGAAPIELYLFQGSSSRCLTSAQKAITFDNNVYEPGFIMHSDLEHNGDLAKQTLTITLRADDPAISEFIPAVPALVTTVAVFRSLGGDFRIVWKGRIASVNFIGDGTAEVVCEPIYSVLRRAGLRAFYQLRCRYALYQEGCGVNRAKYTVADKIIEMHGIKLKTLSSMSTPANYYYGGILRFGNYHRHIYEHNNGWITINGTVKDLKVGSAIELSAGCSLSLHDCRYKFNNHLNYGGFPWIPQEHPFSGDSLIGA